MKWVYQCFGVSKQAYYQVLKNNTIKEKQQKIVLDLIRKVRCRMATIHCGFVPNQSLG